MLPKVYIILLNYKNWEDTIECLESLFKLTYSNFQIIVVDNSPENTPFENMIKWAEGKVDVYVSAHNPLYRISYPPTIKPVHYEAITENRIDNNLESNAKILFIKAEKNEGFAKGNNIALRYILQKNDFLYAWLLNNDTVVEKNSLTELVEAYTKSDKIGILGAKMLYYHHPDILQCVGGGRYFKWLAYGTQIGNGQIDKGQYDNDNIKLDLIIGASSFVSKDFLNDVGLWGEEYFIYFEEPDWGLRAKRKNWKLAYTHKAKVYHKEGASIGGNQLQPKNVSILSDFYNTRNKIIFTKKFYGLICLITVYFSFLLVIVKRILQWKQINTIPMMIKILLNPNKFYKE